MAANFRVSRSSPTMVDPGSILIPSASIALKNDRDFVLGVTREALRRVPEAVRRLGAPGVAQAFAGDLAQLEESGRKAISPALLESLLERLQLLAAHRGTRSSEAIYDRISKRILGTGFKSAPGKSGGGRPPRD